MNLSLEISPKVAALLAVLHDGQLTGEAAVGDVLRKLIDHAQQGVYRPGAWEREWICQAFGDEWLAQMRPDDRTIVDGRAIFERPE
jgi:hypothetical protein